MGATEGKVHQARRRLSKIVKRAERSGCSLSDLVCLSSAERIIGISRNMEKTFFKRYQILISTAVFCILVHAGILSPSSIPWLRWSRWSNMRNDPCTLEMPDELTKIFRPPVACTICRDVTAVEKVANLSPAIFEERYAYTGRPVVVVDGMTNWTAQHVFNFEFFKKIYTERMEEWQQRGCQFFPYKTEFKHLSEVFNMSRERAFLSAGTDPWYVGWSNCDDEINQILRRHYKKPYFLPETAETKRLDWIFMGSTGFGAPMHVDNVEHPSWQAQLRGRKKWSLQPPPECFYECETVDVVVEPGEISRND
ncbi:hypothetical protein RUM43_011977 [Polyplax serrata]|uniref:Cupin-like domain-containing protein n=1 Tax=Polyplax serrata TaxID=468196 RepID=A0AAN8S7H8_POLSC